MMNVMTALTAKSTRHIMRNADVRPAAQSLPPNASCFIERYLTPSSFNRVPVGLAGKSQDWCFSV